MEVVGGGFTWCPHGNLTLLPCPCRLLCPLAHGRSLLCFFIFRQGVLNALAFRGPAFFSIIMAPTSQGLFGFGSTKTCLIKSRKLLEEWERSGASDTAPGIPARPWAGHLRSSCQGAAHALPPRYKVSVVSLFRAVDPLFLIRNSGPGARKGRFNFKSQSANTEWLCGSCCFRL